MYNKRNTKEGDHLNNVFEGLNPEQEAVVKHIFGPSYVIAGPGSGKTMTIVRKIAYAIQNGVDPKTILLFTFTNKAAREIRDRIQNFIGEKATRMTIGTYHSVCVRILRQYIHYLGYNNQFTILDAEDSLKILSELCKGTSLNVGGIASYISEQKRKLIPYQVALRDAIGFNAQRAEIYRNYELRLKAQNSLDFDNLIVLTVKLLTDYPEVRENLHKRYNYIVADEVQDSGFSDLNLIALLTNANQNLTLVGDPDQCIYGFRGSDITSVMSFRDNLYEPKTFLLNRNYRSSQNIVKASCSVIKQNDVLVEKSLFSKNEPGDKIIYSEAKTPEQEAIKIVSFIRHMRSEKYQVPYKEMAILYRTNSQSAEIEKALLKHNIPYELIGRTSFYQRKEIKDIVSYLKFAYNVYDFEALKRIINTPKRGVGAATLEKIYHASCESKTDLLQTLKEAKDLKIGKKTLERLNEFIVIIETLRNNFLCVNPSEALCYLLKEIQYEKHIEKDDDKESRLQNITQLVELSSNFSSIQDLLEQSSLQSEMEDEKNNGDKITVMTLHAAKGLEFDCVYIAGCNEELCPFIKAIQCDNIQEERRLFYVGMTRARKYLFLTRSVTAFHNGIFKRCRESRFIKEIDKEFLFKIPVRLS